MASETTENENSERPIDEFPGVTTVDIFSGAGGLTHGFVLEGLRVVAGIDADASCKYAYETNNPGATFMERDVTELTAREVLSLYPDGHIKVLVGCAPCQPYSPYTNNKSEAKDWKLVEAFASLITGVVPDVVSMENVPQLRQHAVFDKYLDTLRGLSYHIWSDVVECVDYGIPQTRTRLVLLASLLGPIELPPPTHTPDRWATVDQTIGHLERIDAGGSSEMDALHRASALAPINQRRIAATPAGGGWKDWPENLRLECHKRETGKSYGSVYGRMVANEPAPTMTTQCNGLGNGRFGHPTQNRAISLREAALIQTFPEAYDFIDPTVGFNFTVLARHIGNAVPVSLARVIGRTIKTHIQEERRDHADDRNVRR